LAGQGYLLLSGTAASLGFITGTAGAETVVQSAGSQTVYGFDPASGDQIDLRGILAGVSLTPSLSNLINYASVTDGGSDAVLTITSPIGSDTVRLAGAGAPSLQRLIADNAFALPPGSSAA
jgi:hypothetical protein